MVIAVVDAVAKESLKQSQKTTLPFKWQEHYTRIPEVKGSNPV